MRGYDTVRARLEPAFALEEELRLPFFIQHHARSGQLAQTHLQRFRRRT